MTETVALVTPAVALVTPAVALVTPAVALVTPAVLDHRLTKLEYGVNVVFDQSHTASSHQTAVPQEKLR